MRLFIWFCLIIAFIGYTPSHAQDTCVNEPMPQLVLGRAAVVPLGYANNVRESPARDSPSIAEVPGGGEVIVIDGPLCADGFYWYQVQVDGRVGWAIGAAYGDFFLETRIFDGPMITRENVSQLQRMGGFECPEGSVLADNPLWLDQTGGELIMHCVGFGDGIQRSIVNHHIAADFSLWMSDDGGLSDGIALLFWSDDGGELWGVPQGDPPRLYRWNATTTALPEVTELGFEGFITAADISDDGRWLVLAVGGRMVTATQRTAAFLAIVDVDTQTVVQQHLIDRFDTILDVDFNADATRVALVMAGSRYGFWDVTANTLDIHEQGSNLGDMSRTISFLPGGLITIAVTGCAENDPEGGCAAYELAWVSAETGRVTQQWALGANDGLSLAFNESSTLVAIAGRSALTFWDVENDTLLHTIDTRDNLGVLFSLDNRRLFVATGRELLFYGIPE